MATLPPSQADSRSPSTSRAKEFSGDPGVPVRISPAVSVEFLYRDLDQKIPPRVDCVELDGSRNGYRSLKRTLSRPARFAS